MLEGELRVTSFVNYNHEHDPSHRIAKRKFLANVLVRDRVHHFEIRIGPELGDPAPDLDLLVGIVKIDHRERNPRITAGIANLDTAFPGTDQDVVILQSNPDRRIVWRTIRRKRR